MTENPPATQPASPTTPETEAEEQAKARIRIAQASQRLTQEQEVFRNALERDEKAAFQQRCLNWIILAMLPSIAVVCVVIFFKHDLLPTAVVDAASAAFFVDIVGTVIAGYKALMPKSAPETLVATTRDPFEGSGGGAD